MACPVSTCHWPRWMAATPAMPRRGVVLLVVIVIVTIAALTGTTAIYLASGEMGAAGGALKRTQARALAWSGVQAAMAELFDQREQLLDGVPPELTRQWELFTEDSGARGVVRLMTLGEGSVVSESAKLDVNSATAEMLAKVPGIDAQLAAAIVAERGRALFLSVEDLLRVPGMAPEKLLGREADGEPGERGEARTAGLTGLLTVFSFDPNVQSGIGNNGVEHRGNLRLNLRTEWSDRLGQALDERFGDGAGAAVKGVMGKGTRFTSMSDVIGAARQAGLKADGWAPLLDALTVTDDPYLTGRVDVNAAPVEVLGAVPGISEDAAKQIVAMRTGLDDESRRSPAWVASKGILNGEQFGQAVDHLTSRSMQWRVRVEAGVVPRDESGGAERLSEAPLSDRVALEAVIDVSSERPRVAYLREVTMLETARALSAELAAEEERSPLQPTASEPEPAAPGATGHTGQSGATSPTGGRGLDLSSDLDQGVEDLHLGELNLGGDAGSNPIHKDSAPQTAPPPAAAAANPTGGIDRRLGRWTAGKTGGAGAGTGASQ